MSKIRSIVAAQSSVGEPEHRGDERREAARSGGSPTFEPDVVPVVPDSEVPARHARRRFTTAYKLDILRRADACGGHGELGQLLRAEGLYSSHLGMWRQQREAGLMPKTRGRKPTAVDPQLKKLEQENRRLTSRLRRAEALLAFPKKVSEFLTGVSGVGPLAGLAVSGASTGCGRAPAPGATPRAGSGRASERLRSAPHALHRSGAGAGARHVAR